MGEYVSKRGSIHETCFIDVAPIVMLAVLVPAVFSQRVGHRQLYQVETATPENVEACLGSMSIVLTDGELVGDAYRRAVLDLHLVDLEMNSELCLPWPFCELVTSGAWSDLAIRVDSRWVPASSLSP